MNVNWRLLKALHWGKHGVYTLVIFRTIKLVKTVWNTGKLVTFIDSPKQHCAYFIFYLVSFQKYPRKNCQSQPLLRILDNFTSHCLVQRWARHHQKKHQPWRILPSIVINSMWNCWLLTLLFRTFHVCLDGFALLWSVPHLERAEAAKRRLSGVLEQKAHLLLVCGIWCTSCFDVDNADCGSSQAVQSDAWCWSWVLLSNY